MPGDKGEREIADLADRVLPVTLLHFDHRFHHAKLFGQLFEPQGHFVKTDPIRDPRIRIDLVLFKHLNN